MRSSNASAPCRIDWRPSRWLTAALWSLTVLVPLSLWASDLPGLVAWPLALCATGGVAWSALRHRRAAPLAIVVPAEGEVTVAGQAVAGFDVAWRGALAFLSWRDGAGRDHRLALWPDVLDPATRRELRLVMAARAAVRIAGPVAP
jgi:toxin CptA